MLYGILAGNTVIITNTGGKPIEANTEPPAQAGYRAVAKWVDTGTRIIREWQYEPLAGSEQDAVIRLAQIQAQSLPDETAVKVAALYPDWDSNSHQYKKGDRVLFNGTLYRVLQDHTSQTSWTPDAASSLFTKVLAGQDGTKIGLWQQPSSTNAYKKGDRVIYQGHTYESTADGNVWAPRTANAPWKQIA